MINVFLSNRWDENTIFFINWINSIFTEDQFCVNSEQNMPTRPSAENASYKSVLAVKSRLGNVSCINGK